MKTALLLAAFSVASATHAAAADPAFAVATIRPSLPEATLAVYIESGRTFHTRAASLHDVICYAYAMHASQVVGGPAWLSTDRFDITARPDPDAPVNTQLFREMVQKLLADRFHLTLHRDKKAISAYRITVAKNGPKLPALVADQSAPATVGFPGRGVINVKNGTLTDFANFFQRYVLDRPVVNATTISGKYDLTLRWRPEDGQYLDRAFESVQNADGAANLPDLFTAIQDQLGLRMEAAKDPIEILIVDHVEKPSEN